MKISQGVQYCLEYHRTNSKKNTRRSAEFVLKQFDEKFGDREIGSISSDEILAFLTDLTEGKKQTTKRSRYAVLSSFFNLMQEIIDPELKNPCRVPMLRKVFRPAKIIHWKILEKDVVDEIIFRTLKTRNRLMLELMARGGMRVSEVLKLTPGDVDGRKLTLRDPKSGRRNEVVFVPQKVADRLKTFIEQKDIEPGKRLFPLSYQGARAMVQKAGKLVNIHLRPHDLRRHAATHASRSGTPLEVVSKIILRHVNLSTTQRYLGKISETEALKWIENVYS